MRLREILGKLRDSYLPAPSASSMHIQDRRSAR